jgi:hypothetical protein
MKIMAGAASGEKRCNLINHYLLSSGRLDSVARE